jgi:hypothetical protein
LLRALLLAVAYSVLWVLARRVSGPRLATILVLIMALASTNNWEMRAQLFAYPLFALCLYSLLNWQSMNNKTLWILPVATALWSNLHGSFLIAILLAGAAFVFGQGDRRSLGITLALMLLSTLINPRGLELANHVYFMITVPSNQQYSLEWQPPQNVGWQLNIFFASILFFAPLIAWSARKISLMEWAWFLGFGWLALSGIRHVIWFLFLLVALAASPLADVTRGKLDPPLKVSSSILNTVLASSFILFSLFYLPGIREKWWSGSPAVYAPESNPSAAVNWLRAHPNLRGPLWNDFGFGSYLACFLPSRPTWLDPRVFVFPPQQIQEYEQISHASPEWNSLLRRERVNLLFLATSSQSPLIEQVASSDEWCEQYRDPYAVIFSRCEPIE